MTKVQLFVFRIETPRPILNSTN